MLREQPRELWLSEGTYRAGGLCKVLKFRSRGERIRRHAYRPDPGAGEAHKNRLRTVLHMHDHALTRLHATPRKAARKLADRVQETEISISARRSVERLPHQERVLTATTRKLSDPARDVIAVVGTCQVCSRLTNCQRRHVCLLASGLMETGLIGSLVCIAACKAALQSTILLLSLHDKRTLARFPWN